MGVGSGKAATPLDPPPVFTSEPAVLVAETPTKSNLQKSSVIQKNSENVLKGLNDIQAILLILKKSSENSQAKVTK